ncbi:MAG: lactate dehydrogenase [bacterium]|nr:lactate dehydrogenase [bacterium]
MKIGIIGAGRVGVASAFAIATSKVAEEILLIDLNKELAEGEAEDIAQGMDITKTLARVGDYPELADKGLIIVTAGLRRKPEESRLDLIKKNACLMEEIVGKIVAYNKHCLIFVVTNPVDVLTYSSLKLSGFPANKVFGLGTYLDTVRLRSFLIREGLNPEAMVIGEHGDSMVFLGDIPVQIAERTRKAGAEMIKKKGGAGWAVGLAVADVVKAIAKNEKKIFPLTSLINNWNGLSCVCISVPVEVGSSGIISYPEISLTEEEKERFLRSYDVIKETTLCL